MIFSMNRLKQYKVNVYFSNLKWLANPWTFSVFGREGNYLSSVQLIDNRH